MIAARPMIARSDAATVAAIVDVLDGAPPIGLIPERATAAEQAALAARLAAAPVPDDTACVVFTSGSTGRPKGVVLSRAAIAAATAASAAHLGASDDDRWLLALPLGHVAGVAVVARAHRGGRVPRLGTAHDLAAPEVTHASLVPTQLDQVLADPTWRPSPRLRVVLVGGAAAPPALLAAARARGVPVRTTYGMTETFGQIATADADAPEPDGAVGRLLPGVAVVAGTATAPAPLVVRAPGLFTGYLDDPTPLGPAGFPTRDLGYLRGDRLVVCGRADDVIITGGENVYPTEIEAALAAVPGVRAAAAVGVPDPRWGERVAAAVVVEAGVTAAHLEAATAGWPAHRRPRPLAIVAALPVLPSGKLDRQALAAYLRERGPASSGRTPKVGR
ncbi:MAG: AMP-binding protein [Kofleriaceae bacterium]|jgi:O-succinylbenzoic acid--CoA ligase|nr:AMP-binding protein [Kofleriaceae bacterium]MBP9170187.1 AMP-binding protein [Kofleriaceae bacterium]MBP9859818.1 AMP-binding protein [Kofleriaceae bacterium]